MDRFRPNFILLFILTKSKLGLLAVIFRKFVRELWSLIDVRITLPLYILRNSGLLLHAKHCSGAIVRFSDNSSFLWDKKERKSAKRTPTPLSATVIVTFPGSY